MSGKRFLYAAIAAALCLTLPNFAWAQSHGIDLRNSLMPASGGMAGASIAAPQDCISAINGNTAAMTQYDGTTMILGAAWAEPTVRLTQSQAAPAIGVSPFSAKSSTPGSLVPAIGVTQEIDGLPLPVTLGLGFVGAAGAGTSFVGEPNSNNTASYLLLLEVPLAVAVEVTENLSIGGSMVIGDGFSSGPFVGNSKMTNAYSLRGTAGVNYEIAENCWLGAYYLSTQEFRFQDQVVLFNQTTPRDMSIGLPQQVGIGIANSRLLDGKLLLAADALYFDWETAPLFSSIYNNSWAMQLGAQYTTRRNAKLRLGYAYSGNPMDQSVGTEVAGIPVPGGVPSVKYLQSQFSAQCNHRIAGGLGVDIYPGIQLDAFAGGMFPATDQFGSSTVTTLSSYWVGFGLTWHLGDRGQRS